MMYERALKTVGFAAARLVCGLGLTAFAQTASTLPPTPPTSISNQAPVTSPVTAPSLPAETAQRYRARVTYTNGLLEVHADNSSLNQILREVSQQTGMKIVGGVAEQRVFGSYGPAPAATVLQTLLDGTGTNVLLQENAAHEPKQLVLTPRTGGAAPPPPSSSSYNATEAEPELPLAGGAQAATQAQTATPAMTTAPATAAPPPGAQAMPSTSASMAQPASSVPGNANDAAPSPSTTQPANPAPTATATTNQSSPKTPEQIYEELKQLQQKKAAPQATSQGSPTPR